MLYEANSPEDYVTQLDADWRKETLTKLRTLIQASAPDLDENIHYKMLGYGKDENFLFHLNAQKNYVSLYVGNASKIDPDGVLLEGLNVGKGCIRFGKSVNVDNTRIAEFIDQAFLMWQQGADIGC
ncbi:MAG: DUF1801 domain-containing protein [Pseudomonadota bacterium]